MNNENKLKVNQALRKLWRDNVISDRDFADMWSIVVYQSSDILEERNQVIIDEADNYYYFDKPLLMIEPVFIIE